MKILSWNINGVRAAARKGLVAWLEGCQGDVVGLQEVRAKVDELPTSLLELTSWQTHVVSAQRPGYSGVALLSRQAPCRVETSLGEARFDDEGRVQIADFGALRVVNAYFPNGNGKDRDNSRIPYKLEFYQRLFELLRDDFERGRPIAVMGDFNTAHQEIDLARPKANIKTSGFRPEERAELDRWLKAGWVDTFRHFEPGPGHYTWWSQRAGVREKNIGWRIDYVLASKGLMPYLQKAFILPEVQGSDHCPIGVELDEAAKTA